MTTINAHITDERGVYARTVQVDPAGPQPAWAIYDTVGDVLPEALPDHTIMRIAGAWKQVLNVDVPPLPAPEQQPDPVPHSCTRRQGLLALLAYGHRRTEIEALIAAIPDEIEREAALIEYEAATWEITNPFLQHMWGQLGGMPDQLDGVFRMAVTL